SAGTCPDCRRACPGAGRDISRHGHGPPAHRATGDDAATGAGGPTSLIGREGSDVGLQDLPGVVQCRDIRSGFHLLSTPYELTTDLPLQGSLAGLLIGPGECGEGLQMPGIGEQPLLRQGRHPIRMAEPTLQFEKEIQKNILLLTAAPTYIATMLHCRGHQAGCATVVFALEGHLAFE